MNRSNRKQLAEQTVQICNDGRYQIGNSTFQIGHQIEKMLNGTELYLHDDEVEHEQPPSAQTATITVVNDTTFNVVRKLKDEGLEHVGCLNFASAKNPGGGFLNGSKAQEEALARASALVMSLKHKPDYYELNRSWGCPGYSHSAIYSPSVPIFRDEEGVLIPPAYCDIITAPAVNAGALRQRKTYSDSLVRELMQERIRRVLTIAIKHGIEHLVLGAWGCGVFQQNPVDVARWFNEASDLHTHFKSITFAVLDREGGATIEAFENEYAV